MIYRMIKSEKANSNLCLKHLCRLFGVSSSGYYAYHSRPASKRQRYDMVLLTHIKSIFHESCNSYGSPRMLYELRDRGFAVGKRRIARLMRDNNIKARQKARFKRTTDSYHTHPIANNVLQQDFKAVKPNQCWVGDISYVWTRKALAMHSMAVVFANI